MKSVGLDSLIKYITTGTEEEFLRIVSAEFKIDYNYLYNLSEELYSYHRRNNLDYMGAKIFSLGKVFDDAYVLHLRKIAQSERARNIIHSLN